MKNNKGFSLVELMVVISMIAILSAIAIPMYSNHITKTRLTNAIVELDGYKTNIRDFFISQGVTSDEGLTNFPADTIKAHYIGDSDVKIMSVENSGRVLAEREINGTNYQIALTPKIVNNQFAWDCTVFDETNGQDAPARVLPNGCTGAMGNQNDDQNDYTQKFNTLDQEKYNAYDTAREAWQQRTEDAINEALADPNSAYAQALADMDSAKTDKDNSKDALTQANTDLNTAANDVVSKNSALTSAQNAEAIALANRNQANTDYSNGLITQAQRDAAQTNYDTAVTNTATAQTNYDNSTTARNTAQANQSTANTNYNNDYATYSSSVDNVNSQYRSIQDNSKNTDNGSFNTDVTTANTTFTNNVNSNNGMDEYQQTTSTENPDNYVVTPDNTWQSQHYDNNNFSTQYKDSK